MSMKEWNHCCIKQFFDLLVHFIVTISLISIKLYHVVIFVCKSSCGETRTRHEAKKKISLFPENRMGKNEFTRAAGISFFFCQYQRHTIVML